MLRKGNQNLLGRLAPLARHTNTHTRTVVKKLPMGRNQDGNLQVDFRRIIRHLIVTLSEEIKSKNAPRKYGTQK